MSATDFTIEEMRDEVSTMSRRIAGSLRRVAVSIITDKRWRYVGHRLMDNRTQETGDAEAFQGIGWDAKPDQDEEVESVVNFIGLDASHPLIVASRAERLRRLVSQLAFGEAMAFTRTIRLHFTKLGKLVARSTSGDAQTPSLTAEALAKISELQTTVAKLNELIADYLVHTHTAPGGVTGVPIDLSITPAPAVTGTTVMMSE